MPGGQPVPIAELARRRDIPLQFLEQLFATLRRAGLLQSQRGVKGGYSFVQDPGERDGARRSCSCSTASSTPRRRQPAARVWPKAVAALRDVLSGTTIADVVQQEAQAAGAQMYHI